MQAEEIYSVDGLPPEWGVVVADFVKIRAERIEIRDRRIGEYQRTMEDEGLKEELTSHAKPYSRALWAWVTDQVPNYILDWALIKVGDGPAEHPVRRLAYLLFRRETMEWWVVRGRTHQNPANIEYDATRLMGSIDSLQWPLNSGT